MTKSLIKYLIFVILFSLKFAHSFADGIPIITIAPGKSIQSYSSVGSSVSVIDESTINNSSEYFLGVIFFYCLTFFMWKKTN